MFKKLVIGISITTILSISVIAGDLCKIADNIFFKGGLEKVYYKHNKNKVGEVCETLGIGSPQCQGELEAIKIISNQIFNGDGYDYVINLLNKYGIKKQYSKEQIFTNYANFFSDYLKNKLKKLDENERKILLEKFYFFFNRVSDDIINLNKENLSSYSIILKFAGCLKNPIVNVKDTKAAKEVLLLGVECYLSKKNKINLKQSIDGGVLGTFHPTANLKYTILMLNKYRNAKNFQSTDPQLGESASNIDKFFVYAATKQYDKAFNIVNNTYSNKFVKDFNTYLKQACNLK